jgi:hypothetical protein
MSVSALTSGLTNAVNSSIANPVGALTLFGRTFLIQLSVQGIIYLLPEDKVQQWIPSMLVPYTQAILEAFNDSIKLSWVKKKTHNFLFFFNTEFGVFFFPFYLFETPKFFQTGALKLS